MWFLLLPALLLALYGAALAEVSERLPGGNTKDAAVLLAAVIGSGVYAVTDYARLAGTLPGVSLPLINLLGISIHPLWILSPFALFRQAFAGNRPGIIVFATVFLITGVRLLLSGGAETLPPCTAAEQVLAWGGTAVLDAGSATVLYACWAGLLSAITKKTP
ncbi:MAG: hypothetical protein GKC04_03895 [Methanomicrobiales archaeon]|nr:hypothetical protein [Methanomicrobiales archaeon]